VSIGYPPPEDPTGGVRDVETLRMELEDDDDGDLLTQIPDVVAFIRDGLRKRDEKAETSSHTETDSRRGGVLIHCQAGQSRSVAVAMAHVMRSRGLDVDRALEMIRENNSNAQPNDGFTAQLALWFSMDCKLNMADEAYRVYVVAKMAREREYNGYVDATSVRPDPGAAVVDAFASNAAHPAMPFSGNSALAGHASSGPPNGGGAEAGVRVSCRRCRRLVARGANALPHEPGEAMDAFSWRARAKSDPGNRSRGSERCQHVFLEPLAWMKGVEEGPVEGKLCCPKCDAKLGHFNWVGCRCACGAWVAPAFYVQRAKVDITPWE